ncbi:PaiB family negative transcriptional regulator [Cricetibacter osteomyelitidis]|uniref:PaiB family negative transcriptional regulator n=1 Tax=Cricetibacter osteomyelitidis TaxID=1521931 RepID=A0A4R2T225_9PAST|nr:FMN-binding negative transcriptional regulator [Cricetibacter osteomyelitidis]TCP96220.1 PaiB family negative transcriptional regulator [Cricetibacter osteomyelitidis]
MYTPKIFQQTDHTLLSQFMRENPFATVIASTENGLEATHIPLVWVDNGSLWGCLQGHFARANRIWKKALPEQDWLVIFQGADHYISASYYPTKQIDHKDVPTWNYQAVHCKGRLKLVENLEEMKAMLATLTAQSEHYQPRPWQLSDASADYINNECRGIICFEIRIDHIEGKFKLSQNQPPQNRQGVVNGLQTEGTSEAVKMAELIREFG